MLLESDTTKDAIEVLQKQVKDIVMELNVLKEQQALQTGKPDFWSIFNNNGIKIIPQSKALYMS